MIILNNQDFPSSHPQFCCGYCLSMKWLVFYLMIVDLRFIGIWRQLTKMTGCFTVNWMKLKLKRLLLRSLASFHPTFSSLIAWNWMLSISSSAVSLWLLSLRSSVLGIAGTINAGVCRASYPRGGWSSNWWLSTFSPPNLHTSNLRNSLLNTGFIPA